MEEADIYCSITNQIFKDPVVASDGYTYERQAIRDWIRLNQTSPITREKLDSRLITNMYVKNQVTNYLEKHNELIIFQYIEVDTKDNDEDRNNTVNEHLTVGERLEIINLRQEPSIPNLNNSSFLFVVAIFIGIMIWSFIIPNQNNSRSENNNDNSSYYIIGGSLLFVLVVLLSLIYFY